jgi:hypothetical protein
MMSAGSVINWPPGSGSYSGFLDSRIRIRGSGTLQKFEVEFYTLALRPCEYRHTLSQITLLDSSLVLSGSNFETTKAFSIDNT